MPQFIYLLGAGASAEVIPTVRDFAKEMKGFQKNPIIQRIVADFSGENMKKQNEVQDFIIKTIVTLFQKLSIPFEKFGSPDIYAKYLHVNNRKNELKELKFALTFFIQINEYLKRDGMPHQRYLEFIGQICDNKTTTPSNLSILSWNYDNQVELASKYFFTTKDWTNFIPNEKLSADTLSDSKLYKLNGGAFFVNPIEMNKKKYQ